MQAESSGEPPSLSLAISGLCLPFQAPGARGSGSLTQKTSTTADLVGIAESWAAGVFAQVTQRLGGSADLARAQLAFCPRRLSQNRYGDDDDDDDDDDYYYIIIRLLLHYY